MFAAIYENFSSLFWGRYQVIWVCSIWCHKNKALKYICKLFFSKWLSFFFISSSSGQCFYCSIFLKIILSDTISGFFIWDFNRYVLISLCCLIWNFQSYIIMRKDSSYLASSIAHIHCYFINIGHVYIRTSHIYTYKDNHIFYYISVGNYSTLKYLKHLIKYKESVVFNIYLLFKWKIYKQQMF